MVSATTGLTFPGMIDEPGCNSLKEISPIPPFGPLAINLKSVDILEISKQRMLIAELKEQKSVSLEVCDIILTAGTNLLIPVILRISL